MADEESSNQPTRKPNILPAMTSAEVKARAQKIVDARGKWPPYAPADWQQSFDEPPYHRTAVSEEEAAVLSEFVYYWQPYLTLREKPRGS